jgi:hypothetical protein
LSGVYSRGENRKIKNFVPYWSVCCLLCMINCFLLLYPNAIKDQLKFEAALRVILLSLMNHFPDGTYFRMGTTFLWSRIWFFHCLGFHENHFDSKKKLGQSESNEKICYKKWNATSKTIWVLYISLQYITY